jgi:hypothetical protein
MGHPKLLLPVRRKIGFGAWGRTYLQIQSRRDLKMSQDIVLGWLPRIANNSSTVEIPRIASWDIFSRPCGTDRGG